ncbi:MAG TPA: DUF1801 domain-containing protein, partial [Flavobacteriales bacterium]|nr:DUF1801 domain-containing protein [Flavobacteriales bacterium]
MAATKKAIPVKKAAPRKKAETSVKLLAGGNPQIAKGYGDEVVQAYITAIPDWKREVSVRLDALITKAFPKVQKAVKWNTPMYGTDEKNFFMGFHMITKYVKVAFFQGAQLKPLPPDASTQKAVRYLHIHENDTLDEKQFISWVKQAAKLPGEKM